jgi:hypothetical protein
MAFTALHRRWARRSQTGTTVSRCAVAVSTSSRMTLPPGQRLPDHLRLAAHTRLEVVGHHQGKGCAGLFAARPPQPARPWKPRRARLDARDGRCRSSRRRPTPALRDPADACAAPARNAHGKHSLGKARHKGRRRIALQDRHGTDRRLMCRSESASRKPASGIDKLSMRTPCALHAGDGRGGSPDPLIPRRDMS